MSVLTKLIQGRGAGVSAPKHTPGPWKIGAYESGQMAVDGANGEEVTGFIDPEDARLIAAAPETAAERDRLRAENAELLAALKKLCADCNGDKLGTVKAPRLAVLCAAETALAKATRSAS